MPKCKAPLRPSVAGRTIATASSLSSRAFGDYRMHREVQLRLTRPGGAIPMPMIPWSSARRPYTTSSTQPTDDHYDIIKHLQAARASKINEWKYGPILGAPTIRTLQSTKLTSADHLTPREDWPRDDVGRGGVSFYINSTSGRIAVPMLPYDLSKLQSGLGGFLYYHQPARAPPLAGEVRFRITASGDPATFASGVDATTENGIPWCIPLPVIASENSHIALRDLLTRVDGTVSESTIEQASSALSSTPERCVHAFGQPFELPMAFTKIAVGRHRVLLVGKNALRTAELRNIGVADTEVRPASGPGERTKFFKHMPFLGTAVCCFQRSVHPDHAGRRMVVIRVLRFAKSDPVRVDPNYSRPAFSEKLIPREGMLLKIKYRRRVVPWVGDVDMRVPEGSHNPTAALSILFDNALEYGRSPF